MFKQGKRFTKNLEKYIHRNNFFSILCVVMDLGINNNTKLGTTIFELGKKYKYYAWFPMLMFKIGYAQAMMDYKIETNLDFVKMNQTLKENENLSYA